MVHISPHCGHHWRFRVFFLSRCVFVQSVLPSTKIGKLSFPAFELDYLQSYFPSLLPCAREKKSAIRNQLISFLVAQWKLGERLCFVVYAPSVSEDAFYLSSPDLHLIFNLVSASTSFQTAESWTPICLPRFDNR